MVEVVASRRGLEVHQFACLRDDYGFLVHDPASGQTACIDTPDVAATERALAHTGWSLTQVLTTHHHADRAGGNMALKQRTGCSIVGPGTDVSRIPGVDVKVGAGDTVHVGQHAATVHATPGHTRDHVVYHFAEDGIAFVGDTLFPMGCGRLFEGDAAQMWTSLQTIMAWPDDTLIYCAHEYALANARFALSIDGNNPSLVARLHEVERMRARGKATVPTTLGLEKRTNPFLRPMVHDLQDALGATGAPLVDVFAETRRRKDRF